MPSTRTSNKVKRVGIAILAACSLVPGGFATPLQSSGSSLAPPSTGGSILDGLDTSELLDPNSNHRQLSTNSGPLEGLDFRGLEGGLKIRAAEEKENPMAKIMAMLAASKKKE